MLRVRLDPTISGMRRYIKQELGMNDKQLMSSLIFDFYHALKETEKKVEEQIAKEEEEKTEEE